MGTSAIFSLSTLSPLSVIMSEEVKTVEVENNVSNGQKVEDLKRKSIDVEKPKNGETNGDAAEEPVSKKSKPQEETTEEKETPDETGDKASNDENNSAEAEDDEDENGESVDDDEESKDTSEVEETNGHDDESG